jgi:hypothetical protein
VVDFSGVWDAFRDTEFDLETGDLGNLGVRQAAGGFYYFVDETDGRLIKSFVLRRGPQVDTLCNVILAGTTDQYTPRLRFWKRVKKGGAATDVETEDVDAAEATSQSVRASVDLSDAEHNFWTLINFLRSFRGVTLPSHEFRVTDSDDAELLEGLKGHDKGSVLAAVKTYLGGELTEHDVQMLVDRRDALDHFEKLLNEDGFIESERQRLGLNGIEAVWQRFFEDNAWIFGYGLTLVSCDAVDERGLEAVTTGANIFTGAGKRIDAAMRTRGVVQSLVFVEIKKHDTDLLMVKRYREPDVYQVSRELSGAVAQVQKTAHKAVKLLQDLHRQHTPEGEFEYDVSTVEPRKVVIIGNMNELAPDGNVNVEKMTSFELFRRSQLGVEVITFDELLERARFIAETDEPPAA